MCGCVWVYVGVGGCMWVYVGVCRCMWVYVGVCRCMWVYVGVCRCMWCLFLKDTSFCKAGITGNFIGNPSMKVFFLKNRVCTVERNWG